MCNLPFQNDTCFVHDSTTIHSHYHYARHENSIPLLGIWATHAHNTSIEKEKISLYKNHPQTKIQKLTPGENFWLPLTTSPSPVDYIAILSLS